MCGVCVCVCVCVLELYEYVCEIWNSCKAIIFI